MIVRQEQLETLGDSTRRSFVLGVVEKVKQSYPKQCADMEEAAVQKKVELAFERAEANQLTSRNALTLFAELSFLFGSGFDSDPLLPSLAAPIKAPGDEVGRVDGLHQSSSAYVKEVAGPGGALAKAALARVKAESWAYLYDPGSSHFGPDISSRLSVMYPERARAATVEGMAAMNDLGIQSAGSYGMVTGRALALYLTVMFLLGSGFDADPQFAQLSAILNSSGPSESKGERLYQAAISSIEKFMGA